MLRKSERCDRKLQVPQFLVHKFLCFILACMHLSYILCSFHSKYRYLLLFTVFHLKKSVNSSAQFSLSVHSLWVKRTHWNEAVNTVCLGFSDEFIEFSQSWFYRWFLAKITDFGGEDEGFLAKITDFWRRLQIFRRRLRIFRWRLRISLSLPMFTVHTNERGTCTCLHWACADILMRESPLLSMCRCSTGHVQTC